MRFGVVILPDARWSDAAERWREAERLGFDHAWTYDHLTWRSLRDEPWFAAVPTLTAAALVTSSIRLGTLVASPNFRHPVPFAKELMTLDDISRGRITLGLGAGGTGFDATALGQRPWSPRERADRFEEFVGLLDRLLVEPTLSYTGEFYVADEARALPGCVQRPRLPFAIAASGPRGMALAARFAETWVTIDSGGAGPEQLVRMEDLCGEVGRDPAGLRRLVLLGFDERPLESIETFRDVAGRYAEMGFTDLVVHWPRTSEPFRAGTLDLDELAAELAGARDRGEDTAQPV
jgi:alkanesulfonate monooxygenase SsuD/methylene tetrahydromethanopterin reductase-like flavin-dependent oxidoreductase (luciferase family)